MGSGFWFPVSGCGFVGTQGAAVLPAPLSEAKQPRTINHQPQTGRATRAPSLLEHLHRRATMPRMAKKKAKKIDSELGTASYDHDEFGGKWWLERAKNGSHKRAYKTIAEVAAEYATKPPKVIVDFACGPGFLLSQLAEVFPEATLIGIDESRIMLDAAREVLTERLGAERAARIQLVRQALPAFKFDIPKADIVCFSFPDFREDDDGKAIRRLKKKFPDDWKWSKKVQVEIDAEAAEEDDEDPHDMGDEERLFYDRCGMRSVRKLAKTGALMVRVDYAPGDLDTWADCYVTQFEWVCGCSVPPGKAKSRVHRREALFSRFLGCAYRKSKVMQDVYAQTKDEDDKVGGFAVSVFKAK